MPIVVAGHDAPELLAMELDQPLLHVEQGRSATGASSRMPPSCALRPRARLGRADDLGRPPVRVGCCSRIAADACSSAPRAPGRRSR
jgi:hypothetical protein